MPVEYVARYSRAEIQAHPQALYVFGDNFVERALGGQAATARGGP